MVERQLPKLHTGVRFPSSAPAAIFPMKTMTCKHQQEVTDTVLVVVQR